MRINHKILSIPPYISTSWKNVLSLHVEYQDGNSYLIINLGNGATVEVPGLDGSLIEIIFAAHEKSIEGNSASEQKILSPFPLPRLPISPSESLAIFNLPLQLGSEGIENGNMGTILQHNPEAAESPDLPKEMLEKIASLTKVVGLDNPDAFPQPEAHCNCTHCQIMRAIHGKIEDPNGNAEPKESELELVTDEDLKFKDWEIKQTADKLYLVTNPLDEKDNYNVYLGSPVGCTCGEKNCEHIRAVLNS